MNFNIALSSIDRGLLLFYLSGYLLALFFIILFWPVLKSK